MKPDLEQFLARWQPGLLVPVETEIPGDLETPVSAYMKLAPLGARFLLESVESGESLGRYSFIGLAPAREVRLPERPDADPLETLRRELGCYRLEPDPSLPPLLGGAVGYFGYDLVRWFERVPVPPPFEAGIPESVFLMTHALVVFDHVRRTTRVLALAGVDDDPRASYARAVKTVRDAVSALAGPLPRTRAAIARGGGARRDEMPAGAYEERVERAREYIRAGDIFQVVLSRRVSGETHAEPFQVYRALRMLNPSPYMFYLDFVDFQLVGSSPEALVTLAGGVATVRPIAGTRRRGGTPEENDALERELLGDEKERAEHLMLVDLGRNDLGRVSEYGSVRLSEFMRVERYSHVMHLVSRVVGRLAPGRDMFDLFRATFPAGTVSGAPKVRAMEIIAELEPAARGPYAGAVGYFGYGDTLDTCIAIRTVLMKDGRYWLQSGAGIVADSVPEREYQETVKKMEALRRALDIAEAGF